MAGSGSGSGSGFGIDIMNTAPPFEFQVGALSQACIDIAINDDDDLEGDHAFTVELGVISIPALGGVGTPLATTITIQDPDGMLVRWQGSKIIRVLINNSMLLVNGSFIVQHFHFCWDTVNCSHAVQIWDSKHITKPTH